MAKLFPAPLYLALIVVAVALSAAIALQTRYNAHPDELVHLDAFCFFRSHWWPPPLDAEGLVYSPDGWSRVYNGEVVYLLFGQLSHWLPQPDVQALARRLNPPPAISYQAAGHLLFLPLVARVSPPCLHLFQRFRLLNTLLYGVTLLILFRRRTQAAWIGSLGILLMAIPQVLYLYSYANSDAWGLSCAIFLVLFAVARAEGGALGWMQVVALAVLTGLVILSKTPFLLAIPLAYMLLGYRIVNEARLRFAPGRLQPGSFAALRVASAKLILWAVVFFIVVAPLKVVYPLMQEDYQAKAMLMRERRSWAEFNPNAPSASGYLLASRGAPFALIATSEAWWRSSLRSLYGLFGYMTVAAPAWAYGVAAAIVAAGCAATLGVLWARWSQAPPLTRLLVAASPLFIALSFLASLYNSWTYDFQPQGRYLFPALIPLAVLMGGTLELEPGRLRALRIASWLLLYGVGVYVLWSVVLPHPLLVDR